MLISLQCAAGHEFELVLAALRRTVTPLVDSPAVDTQSSGESGDAPEVLYGFVLGHGTHI